MEFKIGDKFRLLDTPETRRVYPSEMHTKEYTILEIKQNIYRSNETYCIFNGPYQLNSVYFYSMVPSEKELYLPDWF